MLLKNCFDTFNKFIQFGKILIFFCLFPFNKATLQASDMTECLNELVIPNTVCKLHKFDGSS